MTSESDRTPSEHANPGNSRPGASRDLLSRFARGDREALDQLLKMEEARLRRHVTARFPAGLERRVGVSDILQQTAVELIELRDRFEARGRSAFRGLVHRLAERALARAIRHERATKRDIARHDSLGGSIDHAKPTEQSTPSQVFVRREDVTMLKRCFGQLPCSDRLVLRMFDEEGCSYQELARALDVNEATARQRRHRALVKLRRLMRASDANSRLDPPTDTA